MTNDYLKYYDLEAYLFEDVRRRFHKNGRIDAFDLFSIIVWKSNRSKSRLARRLTKKSGTLQGAATQFTSALFKAGSAEARLRVAYKEWGFNLPMASAILTVLWPKYFTVFDVRVCEELKFQFVKRERVWLRYSRYRESVKRTIPSLPRLRDKDRFLWGRSAARQLVGDIARGFSKAKR
jgi:hypothetical protein